MQGDSKKKRALPVTWWKLILGISLIAVGGLSLFMYLNDTHSMFLAVAFIVTAAPGVYLIFTGLKTGDSGLSFFNKGGNGKGEWTGRENAIIWIARRNTETGKDLPVILKFAEIEDKKVPKGARLHYVRNLKRRFYELRNDTKTNKLLPVTLPDKKSFPPELFQIPAAMQTYKDAIDYSPPSLLQKVAPGVLLLAMGIVGLLMVVTGD